MTDAGNAVIALQTRDYILRQYQVSSLVHATQMRSVWMRKFVNITDNRHSMPMAANVQKRKFARALPDQAWVRDITYIRISFEWPHLVTVLGLYSRKIAVWGMAPWMPEKLVCAALQMAV